MNFPELKSISKYEQIQNLIIDKIKSNELQPGTSLPSETQMAKDLKIHRLTINKAFSNLVRDGYLYREHGRGTFVNKDIHKMLARKELKSYKNVAVIFVGWKDVDKNDYFAHSFQMLSVRLAKLKCSLTTEVLPDFQSCEKYLQRHPFLQGVVLYTFNNVTEDELLPRRFLFRFCHFQKT